jgi:hypothetical protein
MDGGVEPFMADVCMGIRWLPFALTFHHGKKNEGKNKKSDTKTWQRLFYVVTLQME